MRLFYDHTYQRWNVNFNIILKVSISLINEIKHVQQLLKFTRLGAIKKS